VEAECASAFNLTAGIETNFTAVIDKEMFPEEVKNIMLSFPTTIQEKCFLKCFGEETDLVFVF